MRIARIVGILQANEFASNLRTNSTHPPCLHVWNGVVLVSSEAAGVPSLEDCRGFRSNRQHRQLEKVVFTSALFRSPRTATRTLDKPCLAHSLRRRLLAQAPPVTVHQGIASCLSCVVKWCLSSFTRRQKSPHIRRKIADA